MIAGMLRRTKPKKTQILGHMWGSLAAGGLLSRLAGDLPYGTKGVDVIHRSKGLALGLLRLEIENLRKYGVAGLLCLCRPDEPCGACPLIDFVPPEFRKEPSPCLYIPLNQRGETVDKLLRERNVAYLNEQLITWMEQAIQQLQMELRRRISPTEGVRTEAK